MKRKSSVIRPRVYSPPLTREALEMRERIKRFNAQQWPNLEPRSHDDYERMDARFKP